MGGIGLFATSEKTKWEKWKKKLNPKSRVITGKKIQTKQQNQPKCNSRHCIFICGKNENVLLTNSHTYSSPAVITSIEGITCCTLIDTGAGASYISSTVINE